MSSYVCLAPTLLDHSFPKNDAELERVSDALGAIQEYVENKTITLILTDILIRITDLKNFDYSRFHESPILRDIKTMVLIWLSKKPEGTKRIDISNLDDDSCELHPVPLGMGGKGLVEFWQEEMGKILYIHNKVKSKQDNFFIGVACECAFAGEDLNKYDNPNESNCFPLVGPNNLKVLDSAMKYEYSNDINTRKVSIDDFKKNCKIIGVIKIKNGGNHPIAKFENGRSWPFNKKWDVIHYQFLKQISEITDYPIPFIKYCLTNGRKPKKVSKLKDYLL